jgi:hypothetical protein
MKRRRPKIYVYLQEPATVLTVAGSCKYCCPGKAINGTYSECAIAALGIKRAMRFSRIVICDLSGSTVFSTLSHKRHEFRKRLLNIRWFF